MAKMVKGNQESSASVINESVTMDTRKFLSTVNNSAQSQIAFFEGAVRRLGEQYGQEWTLASLHSNKLIIEDAKTHRFLTADHAREKGGKIKISNIKNIELVEGKKPELFENACLALVEALEVGDAKQVDTAFNKVAASRFRSTAIPSSGVIKTKDGVVRHVEVDEGKTLGDRVIGLLSDQITISESGNVEGVFTTDALKDLDLGVTELTTRRLVAKNMRDVAEHAYKSPNFQTLVETVAGLVCKDNLEQAIDYSARFLREHQEFCLLDRIKWNELISNTLATKCCFNEDLSRDAATLMFKTNLKVNHDELIDAWRKTAEKAQHPVMLENIDNLAESKNFEADYDEFLGTIFEATGEVTRGALIAGLDLLRQKVNKGEVDDPTSEELGDLINQLKQGGDSKAMWEAMETLDAVRRHTDKAAGLDSFDEMPGPGSEDEVASKEPEPGVGGAGIETSTGAGAASGSDKPLEISIKMDPAKMAQSAVQGAAPAAPPAGPEGGEEFDLGSLDDIDLEGGEEGGGEGEVGGEAGAAPGKEDLLAAGLDRNGKSISEDAVTDFLKGEGIEGGEIVEADESEVEVKESAEPEEAEDAPSDDIYSLPNDIELEGTSIDKNYQTLIEVDEIGDMHAVEFDKSIKDKKDIDKNPDTLQAAAEAYIREKWAAKLQGVRDPKQQQQMVTDLAGQLAAKRLATRKKALGEDQYKSPLRQLAKRGLKRAAVAKLVKENNLKWIDRDDTAILGEYKGIKFVIDHGETPAALLSEDGNVQVPIPDEMVPGALFISEASNDEAEADAFVEWLDEIIESLESETVETEDDPAETPVAESSDGEVADSEDAGDSKDEAVSEECPEHLKKYQFKKKDAKEEPEKEEEPKKDEPEEPKKDEEPDPAQSETTEK